MEFHRTFHNTSPCPDRVVPPCNTFFGVCREAVSRKKKRLYDELNDFDLDLTYISPRIIVHGFPSVGLEHFFRNPRFEIRRFMDYKHGNHYKVFNFCAEPGRNYPIQVFYGRVERFPFYDHFVPTLESMAVFTQNARSWLDESIDNVVGLHCKAGKGRAGMMCCMLLIRTGDAQTAKEAMDMYDRTRTNDGKGLTLTRQRKYVVFYELLWRKFWNVHGDIGLVPASVSKEFSIPEQPQFTVVYVGIRTTAESTSTDSLRFLVFNVDGIERVMNFDSGKLSQGQRECACLPSEHSRNNVGIRGNFVIVVYLCGITFQRKLCELHHNTIFIDSQAEEHQFPIDQLDIKRKVAAKFPGLQLLVHTAANVTHL